MPSPTTTDEFLDLVRKSGVVEEKRLTAYLERLRAAPAVPSDPPKLAGALVADGLLTQFQAEQFLQGRWRRFTLGKYKVLEKLGSGGMGNVFLCEHKLMRRRVAVKVLPAAKADDSAALERFYREARAVAALDHPNIVRAYDIDQDEKLHFLVMEHVDGSSLQEIIKRTGPMDVLRACHYVRQAALGLQHAHEAAGIVHRDIKPGNILVDRNGIVKILDMGLARFFHDEDDVLTKKYDENVLGTADYLAPEQALDSHSVDIRADIYSLGATFYFCLTGKTPFAEGTVAQKLIWHQTRQPKPVLQLRPEVPEGVVAIVEKMMAKDAAQRFQLPAEVAEALAPWTQTPIPPPPEKEMPQLSPAAMGPPTGETSLVGGPKTPPSGNPLSPTPRKLWQVTQSATPSPLASPPTPPAEAPRDLRKTNPPPPGPLALELPPPRSPASRSVPTAPANRPVPSDGGAKPAPPAPVPPPDEEAPWGDLAAANGSTGPGSGATPRAARHGPVSMTRRVGGLPPTPPARKMGWVVGVASALVLALVVTGGVLAWIFSGKSPSGTPQPAGPVVLHVNRLGTNGAASSVGEALARLRGHGKHGARIVVQDDLAENDVLIDVSHVSIEPEAGKTIRWRPSSKPGAIKLFSVSKAEGVRVKGFTLDGENRVDYLVNLYHHCPGTHLQDLHLSGFRKYAVFVTNCEGGEAHDRRVVLSRMDFHTSRTEQAALFFSIQPFARDTIPQNKYITVRDCTFDGPGAKARAEDPSALDHVEGVQPEQGR